MSERGESPDGISGLWQRADRERASIQGFMKMPGAVKKTHGIGKHSGPLFSRAARLVASQVVIAIGLLAVAPSAAPAQDERPAEVLSWRHQALQPAAYDSLAGRWAAYVAKHPTDPRALVEWGDALRYSGKYEEASEKYKSAFALDSLDAAAVVARCGNAVVNDQSVAVARLAHDRLVRLVKRDPDYPDTYYILWITAMRVRDDDMAKHALKAMVELGDMPKPLIEYGTNMVQGAPPNAIVFTNGDNDTYPPLAYQAVTGSRPDVALVNQSLLNAPWYIRYWRDHGLPIKLTDAQIDTLRSKPPERLASDLVQEDIYRNLEAAGWPRPLFYSVTCPRMTAPGGRSVEGLLVRVVPGEKPKGGKEEEEPEYDWNRTRELVDTVYHFDGASDPLIDWKKENSVSRLGQNYASILGHLGEWLVGTGATDEGGLYLYRAVKILSFHGQKDEAGKLIDSWSKADPGARLLPKAKELIGGR